MIHTHIRLTAHMSRGFLARGRFTADKFERSLSTTTKVVVGIQWATTTTVVVGIERVTTTTVAVGIKWVNVTRAAWTAMEIHKFQHPKSWLALLGLTSTGS